MIIGKQKETPTNQIRYLEISGPLLLGDDEKTEWTMFLNTVLKTLFENKKAIKRAIISSFKRRDNSFSGITLDINKLSREELKKYHLDEIISGKIHPKKCVFCGCHYITLFPYTYRGTDGCVGRSYKCSNCRSFSDKIAYKFYERYKKSGTEKVRRIQEMLFIWDGIYHHIKCFFKAKELAG